MKIITNILYLEFQELVECGVSEGYLKVAKSLNVGCWSFIKDPSDGRKVLVQYDSLKPKYKMLVMQQYNGCPYVWYAKQGFKQQLQVQPMAYAYYNNYTLNDGTKLPLPLQERYVLQVQVLEVLAKDWKQVTEAIGYIKTWSFDFPSTEETLRRKLKKYLAEGYESLVTKKLRNNNAEKEKHLPLLRQLAGRPNNYNHTTIAHDYNQLAAKLDLPALSHSTVYNIATSSTVRLQIEGQRRGKHAWRNNFDTVVKRKRPTYPLLMTVHDGFDWELYYQKEFTETKINKETGEKTTKTSIKYHLRKNILVVLDAYNDYPLGYAIGERETGDLIIAALRNAAAHVKELTGQYYAQWEIKSDNFGGNEAKAFYAKIAPHVSPSAVGNARDKVIESWFGRHLKAFTVRHKNYAGHNIDALKKNQPNRDFLDAHKKYFPDEMGVAEQIIGDIELDRAGKRADWLAAFEAMPQELKRTLSEEEYLSIYGVANKKTIRLTNMGIVLQIDHVKYQYQLLQKDFVAAIGSDIRVHYDSADMSRILAVDEAHNRQWLVHQAMTIPMARKDQGEGDRENLNKILRFKEEIIDDAILANAEDMSKIESEGMLKGYFIQKGTNKHEIAAAKRGIHEYKTIERTETTEVAVMMAESYRSKGSLKQV